LLVGLFASGRLSAEAIRSLATILVKKMPAALRQPASFTIGASAASIYAAL